MIQCPKCNTPSLITSPPGYANGHQYCLACDWATPPTQNGATDHPGVKDDWYRQQAFDACRDKGLITIDHNAIVSHAVGGEGAYVQAWVFVRKPETEQEE